jgi:hypothetical protein
MRSGLRMLHKVSRCHSAAVLGVDAFASNRSGQKANESWCSPNEASGPASTENDSGPPRFVQQGLCSSLVKTVNLPAHSPQTLSRFLVSRRWCLEEGLRGHGTISAAPCGSSKNTMGDAAPLAPSYHRHVCQPRYTAWFQSSKHWGKKTRAHRAGHVHGGARHDLR